MLHGKLRNGFSDATIKILDSEEAMLPDKLMPWGTPHMALYGKKYTAKHTMNLESFVGAP